jgi:hypothetical protein
MGNPHYEKHLSGERRSYAQNQPLGTYDARALEIFRPTATKSANCNQSEKENRRRDDAKRAGRMRKHSPGPDHSQSLKPSRARNRNDQRKT